MSKIDDIMPDPERWTGGLTQGVTQFGMGFVTGKKLVTGLTYGVKAIPAVNTARNITAAAFADGAFFNSYEARLSDLINEHAPWASNALTDYLASDPEDTFWEGRFKNVIEGGAIGGLAETIFLMASLGKKVHDAKQKKNLEKLLNEEQFVKDTERLEELVTDLDSSIKEAADEKLAQTKELKTNVTSTADNIPIQKEAPDVEVKDTPDPLEQRRIDDRVIKEAESKKAPLKEDQIETIVTRAKDEYLGLGEKTAEIVLRQVEDIKSGKSKELDLDTGINVKNLTGTDRDAIVFDIVTEQLKKNNTKLKAVERQVVVKNAADILARNPSEVLVRIDKLAKEVKALQSH